MVQATATYVFEDFQEFIPFVIRMADAYMICVGLMVVISIFNTLDHYLKQTEALKDKPIDSYFQLARMVDNIVGGVIIVAKVFLCRFCINPFTFSRRKCFGFLYLQILRIS